VVNVEVVPHVFELSLASLHGIMLGVGRDHLLGSSPGVVVVQEHVSGFLTVLGDFSCVGLNHRVHKSVVTLSSESVGHISGVAAMSL